jgi:hypothetical protein
LIDPPVANANITQAPPIAIDRELDLHCITAPISKLSKIAPAPARRQSRLPLILPNAAAPVQRHHIG